MKRRLKIYISILVFFVLVAPTLVVAQDSTSVTPAAVETTTTTSAPAEQVVAAVEEAATLDSGNTAWIIVATILVMLMTIPGLALFYGGLVRQKNILSVIMQCLLSKNQYELYHLN